MVDRQVRLLTCGFVFAIAGCGPLQTPLPPRLDDEGQKTVDQAWDNTLSEANRFDKQTLLDILMCTRVPVRRR